MTHLGVGGLTMDQVSTGGPTVTVARTVADVLDEHVTLEVECIDRMYLNLYVPLLQTEGGVANFWRVHRGHNFASSALMAPMSKKLVDRIESFAECEGLDLVRFRKGMRKEDIAKRYLAGFEAREGGVDASVIPSWRVHMPDQVRVVDSERSGPASREGERACRHRAA